MLTCQLPVYLSIQINEFISAAAKITKINSSITKLQRNIINHNSSDLDRKKQKLHFGGIDALLKIHK